MDSVFAFGLGIASHNATGNVMDTYFPAPLKTPSEEVCEIINAAVETRVQEVLPEVAARLADKLDGAEKTAFARLAELDQMLLAVKCEVDDAIQSTPEAYLKLHLFSHRLALPNTLNLDGIFEHLPTLAWTTEGPVDLDDVQARIIEARTSGRTLYGVVNLAPHPPHLARARDPHV